MSRGIGTCLLPWIVILGCAQPAAPSTAAPLPTPAEDDIAEPDVDRPSATPADENNVNPDVNERYTEDSKIHDWVAQFEREGREVKDRHDAILAEIALRHGTVVADIGVGTGLFTVDFARAVGKTGKVFAVDVMQLFLDHVMDKTAKAGLDNITPIKATQKSVELPERSVDVVFMCDVYHHLEFPRTYLATIHAAMRIDGELIVIDFEKIPGKSEDWILEHVRADRAQVIAEIEAAGFVLEAEPQLLRDNYVLRFRRR